MKPILLFLTCADDQEADTITATLLREKVVVCVKKMPVSSSFLWQGKTDHAEEVLLVMESEQAKFKLVEKTVRWLHSYDMPVLVSVSIIQTSSGINKWIKTELKIK